MSEKLKGSVVHVPDAYTVVINRGSDHGVKQGDRYLVYGLGPEIFDPESNSSLGALEVVRGRASVVHVQEKMCTLRTVEFQEVPGRRKIVKRENANSIAVALGLGVGTEEIEEGPERNERELSAKVGDQAKAI